ncbi:ABC transporter [Spraguea lophii 42_110]|uniref:ABC transporter n=1 Tax=Spraguea lophii (strain 42_110) TaxID=1358809 RepID=S7XT51_SPRLO|nr:ABC transporter [Spraguea lophii 42_110]
MDISWNRISVHVPNRNTNNPGKYAHILEDSNGCARRGKLLAIMGPSGSGKTTFLKALVGRIPPGSKTSGTILGDGKERKISDWIQRSAYVDQDDSIYDQLSVYETVLFAAKFRSKQDNVESKVTNILEDLRIDNIAHNKMNSISGGERKRAMIAVELVSDPDLYFLDEPTSGLDTFMTISFVKLLKEYAVKNNKTIVLTIHQPPQGAFNAIDDLMLLAKGKTIYCGEAKKCEKYFNNFGFFKNEEGPFSDYVLEVLVRKDIESAQFHQMIEANKKKYGKDEIDVKYKKSNDSYVDYSLNLKHLFLLLKRRFLMFTFTQKKIIEIIIKLIFLVLPIIYNRSYWNRFSSITDNVENRGMTDQINLTIYVENIFIFTLVFMSYATLYLSVNVSKSIYAIAPESQLVRREMGVCIYSVTSYYLSVFIHEAIEHIIINLIFISTLYFTVNRGISWIYFIFMIIGVIFFLPVYIMLGSITTDYRILYIFSILTFIISLIPVIPIFFFPEHIFKSIGKLCYVVLGSPLFWSPTYYVVFFASIFFKYIFVSLLKTKETKEMYRNIVMPKLIDVLRHIIPKLSLHFSVIGILSICTTGMVVIMGLFVLGRLLKPDFRMKMS